MRYEKARIRNRTIEQATGATQDNRVNFNNQKNNC